MNNYFRPKKFESYGNKPIYVFFGIKLYKKFLPMTGDIARKRRKMVQIKPTRSGRISELYRYEKQTRRNELLHILATMACIGLIFVNDKVLTLLDVLFLTVLNLSVNIYPIFLQRYNRIRIIRVLLSTGQRNPYDVQG